jgi:hypothetical protein
MPLNWCNARTWPVLVMLDNAWLTSGVVQNWGLTLRSRRSSACMQRVPVVKKLRRDAKLEKRCQDRPDRWLLDLTGAAAGTACAAGMVL